LVLYGPKCEFFFCVCTPLTVLWIGYEIMTRRILKCCWYKRLKNMLLSKFDVGLDKAFGQILQSFLIANIKTAIKIRCQQIYLGSFLFVWRVMNFRLVFCYYSTYSVFIFLFYLCLWMLNCLTSPSVIEFLSFCGNELKRSSETSDVPINRHWS
jgi:hypothetical protein